MRADECGTMRSASALSGYVSPRRPEPPDVAPNSADPVFGGTAHVFGDDDPASDMMPDSWRRQYNRQLLREFLRSVPRAESEAILTLVQADGSQRLFTRAQLSTAVDRLRPRQRQIIRLALEERWPRQRVCGYLNNISLKTLMRDQREALDLLAE